MDYQLIKADSALCSQTDPELFFAQEVNTQAAYLDMKAAKRLCASCPLTMLCLRTAIENKEEYGIWGGATPRERNKITTKQQAEAFVVHLKNNFTGSTSRRRR